jgi:heptosyltransferase II
MSWISYAQNREDVLLRRALGDAPPGFYVDVGACDPIKLSITKHFYDLGWRGINIDASPVMWELLVGGRPRDINLNIGISNKRGEMTFYRAVADAYGGDASGLSTFVAEEVAVHRANGFVFEELVTKVTTLADICAEHVTGPISFMSIDVEGHEREVLEGADFRKFRPRIILVESTRPKSEEATHQRWEDLILGNDYLFGTFDGLNRYYVRAEDRALVGKLQVPPNVFDDFVPYEYQHRIEELEAEVRMLRTTQRVLTTVNGLAKWVGKQAETARDRLRVAASRRER